MGTPATASYVSILGMRLGLGAFGQMVHRRKGKIVNVTSPAVEADITVANEVTNVRKITVQLHGAGTDALAERVAVDVLVLNDAGTTFAATGGSTGIEIDDAGALLSVVAKKQFTGLTDATGKLNIKWTDTGTESVSVAVRLPNGVVVRSEAFANT